MRTIKLALLDLYNGEPNLGIPAIGNILERFGGAIEWERFDVRQQAEVPAVDDFDIFISSGGPGSPLEGDGVWDLRWGQWVDDLLAHNRANPLGGKHAFFICHSFQMLCRHLQVGVISKRDVKSFGTFPVHLTEAALTDPIFALLPDPFYAADFRDYQVLVPEPGQLNEMGAGILAMEMERAHLPDERAVMAIRFSDEILAVQFHPEAHVRGMLTHFQQEERMVHVITNYGKKKYEQMIRDLSDPDKIQLTHDVVIPSFLENALEVLKETLTPA